MPRKIKHILRDEADEKGHLELAIQNLKDRARLMKKKGITARIRIEIEVTMTWDNDGSWAGCGTVDWAGKI